MMVEGMSGYDQGTKGLISHERTLKKIWRLMSVRGMDEAETEDIVLPLAAIEGLK